MSPSSPTRSMQVFAPVKLNLHLHITGKRDDGYHLLDSLVCFVDIGDTLSIEAAPVFDFIVDGPYARSFTAQEKDASRSSQNIMIRALWSFCDLARKEPNFRLRLKKTVPLGGGIGGGSSDAAALIWALSEWWGVHPNSEALHRLLSELGTDLPVCYACAPRIMRGVGDDLLPAPDIPELPVLLVHCGKSVATPDVYAQYDGGFGQLLNMPEKFDSNAHFIDVLKSGRNDLTEAALSECSDIAYVIDQLRAQDGAQLVRMSGSGATCFAIFDDDEACMMAAENIIRDNPLWWVRQGKLNTPRRY